MNYGAEAISGRLKPTTNGNVMMRRSNMPTPKQKINRKRKVEFDMVYYRHRFSWERELEVQRAWMRASARGFGYLQSIGSWASWERELEVQRAWMRAPARMDMKFFF
jgi:hypothetical protein